VATLAPAAVVEIGCLDSPVGPVTVAARAGRLCAVSFGADRGRVEDCLSRRFGPVDWRDAADPAGAVSRLRAYFGGNLHALEALEVDPGGTPFQQKVWLALRNVAAGTTVSYGTLARLIGMPDASRAVGAANGANPVAIVIPCHRVVGTAGGLVGYGGGLARKRWLLAHEGALSPLFGPPG
jgi:methylated-DNA-[protein]-cysteine S-methyltransferase